MPECPKHGHELELAFVHDGFGYWDCPSCQPLYKRAVANQVQGGKTQ